MSALRSWLLSVLLATAFAMGVVSVVIADPATMLDEEDQHGEESERGDADMELTGHDASAFGYPVAVEPLVGCDLAVTRFGVTSSDAPTREHRIDLHRPPSA